MTTPASNGSYGAKFSRVSEEMVNFATELGKKPTELGKLEIAVLNAFAGVRWAEDDKKYGDLQDGIHILAKSVKEGEDVESLQQGIGKMERACEFLRKSPVFKKNGVYLKKLTGLTNTLREATASLVRAEIGSDLNELVKMVKTKYPLVKSLGQHLGEQSVENRSLTALLQQDYSKMDGLDVIQSAYAALELIYIGLFQIEELTAKPIDGALIKKLREFQTEMEASLKASPEFENNLEELEKGLSNADLNLAVLFTQSKIGSDLRNIVQELQSLQSKYPILDFRTHMGLGSDDNKKLDLLLDQDYRKIDGKKVVESATTVIDLVFSGLKQLVDNQKIAVDSRAYQRLAHRLTDINNLVEKLNTIIV